MSGIKLVLSLLFTLLMFAGTIGIIILAWMRPEIAGCILIAGLVMISWLGVHDALWGSK